jgi:catechol 2,3-dioxygenase-like lactoylglutathione lyase family enzyme
MATGNDQKLDAGAAPGLDAFDHVHVFVRDRAASERWYACVLGLGRSKELEFWATSDGPLTLQNTSGSIHLALFERELRPCRSTIALRVGAGQYVQWRDHLTRVLPGAVTEEDHAASISLYFSDIDGNPYEITTYERGGLFRTIVE